MAHQPQKTIIIHTHHIYGWVDIYTQVDYVSYGGGSDGGSVASMTGSLYSLSGRRGSVAAFPQDQQAPVVRHGRYVGDYTVIYERGHFMHHARFLELTLRMPMSVPAAAAAACTVP